MQFLSNAMDLSSAYLADTSLPLTFEAGMPSNTVRAESGLESIRFSAMSSISQTAPFRSQLPVISKTAVSRIILIWCAILLIIIHAVLCLRRCHVEPFRHIARLHPDEANSQFSEKSEHPAEKNLCTISRPLADLHPIAGQATNLSDFSHSGFLSVYLFSALVYQTWV